MKPPLNLDHTHSDRTFPVAFYAIWPFILRNMREIDNNNNYHVYYISLLNLRKEKVNVSRK